MSFKTSRITFSSRRESHQTYENLKNFLDRNDSEKILRESFSLEHKIGEGFLSEVFKIQDVPDFVLKVDKFQKNPLLNINPVRAKDYFPELNLGQPLAHLNKSASILVRQSGTPCGIRYFENKQNKKVTQPDVQRFIEYLKKIDGYPQAAYDNFEKEIKTIYERNHMFDFVNSQNVLADSSKKAFNIIDIIKRRTTRYQNCDLVMPMALLDFQNYPDFLKMANAEEREKILNLSSGIVNKSKNAYYAHNKRSFEFFFDFYGHFIGIKNSKEITSKFFEMKRIFKSLIPK